MASDGTAVQIPVATTVSSLNGQSLPSSGRSTPPLPGATSATGNYSAAANQAASASSGAASSAAAYAAASSSTGSSSATSSATSKTPVAQSSDPQSLVQDLNKFLNQSGRPDQFRLDPADGNLIQQINPTNGVVIGQFSVLEFPALARSVGVTGLLINSHA